MTDLAKLSDVEVTWTLRPEVLLSGVIPPPMWGLAPRVVMGRTWWDKVRREAAAKTKWHCISCGVYKDNARGPRRLEGHELYKINYKLGRMTYVETVPLCHFCHSYIHIGLLQFKLIHRQISQNRYIAIVRHGDAILQEIGLERFEGPYPVAARWEDWRMVFEGREYPPRNKPRR